MAFIINLMVIIRCLQSPWSTNSIQMMSGGKLMANQTVRIVRDRTSVSVNENVRTLYLGKGSN